MNYRWYEQDISDAWISKLFTTYGEISNEVSCQCQKNLTEPNFKINPNLNYRWAEWDKTTRTITFSLNLLKQFEWEAVKHVMKHEVAHQIVDEIFVIEHLPHGAAWQKACTILNIDPNVTESATMLSKYKSSNTSPMIEKIHKLLLHGNDCHISQEESQLFLNKAQELMIKHNISMLNVQGIQSDAFYVFRPVGPLVDGHKSWLGNFASFITSFYNVQSIWLSCNGKKRIEFFGTPDNLDVAEYVFHALLTQAEYLWQEYKTNHQDKFKNDPDYRSKMGNTYNGNSRRISKKAYMQGLINGYRSKLTREKTIIFDSISPSDKAIISTGDKMLRDAFEHKYHPCKHYQASSNGNGYSDGHIAGSKLTLAQGVKTSCNRMLMLT